MIGRPLESPLPRECQVTFRLNSRELECLEAYAFRYDQSVSDVIRDCLEILSIIPTNPGPQ